MSSDAALGNTGSPLELVATAPVTGNEAAPGRWVFTFALRDTLPLNADGYTMYFHDADQCPPGCAGPWTCVGSSVRLSQRPTDSVQFHDALSGLLELGQEMQTLPTTDPIPLPDPEELRSYAVVVAPTGSGDPDDARSAAIKALQRAVNALRLSTEGTFPRFTWERLWPAYLLTQLDPATGPAETTLVLVKGVNPYRTPAPATEEQLAGATHMIAAASRSDPIEVIRDFQVAAQAAQREGDYVQCVLSAAAACEVMVKHAAAMLIWETSTHTNPAPAWLPAAGYNPLAPRPSQLMGAILSQALGGSWNSQTTTAPVGAWREHVARVRTKIIHRGYRPTSEQAEAAVYAMHGLTTHIADRLAARASNYPRTAVCLVSTQGLKKRGADGRVRATLQAGDAAGEDWRGQYQAWLATVDTEADPDD